MTDPTTKDLIEEARSRTCVCSSHQLRNSCNACVCAALADRLEEVEEAYQRESRGHTNLARAVDREDGIVRARIWTVADSLDLAGSPEPSDPSWDATVDEIHAELAGDKEPPEPSDPEPEKPPAQSTTEPDYPDPDPEPEDDPWETLEQYQDGPWKLALLDLRERVEGLDAVKADARLRVAARGRDFIREGIGKRLDALERQVKAGDKTLANLALGNQEDVRALNQIAKDTHTRLEAVEGLAHPSVAPVVDAMLPRLDQLQAVSDALEDRIEDGPDGEVQARLLALESRVGGAAKDRGNLLRDVRRLMERVEEIERQMPPEVS